MIAELAFWASSLLVVHAFAGYPAWVMLLARIRPAPIARGEQQPAITAVVSVYNGAEEIKARLDNLFALDYPADRLRVLVVCDGCSDDTADRCRAYPESRLRVVELAERRGKAAALAAAVAEADTPLLLLTDLRQQLQADALARLVACLADPEVGAVGGVLKFVDPDTGFARSVDAYWRYETAIRHAESRSGSTVGVSGALYAMRRDLNLALPDGTVLDDVLTPMQVVRAGKRVVLEPGAVALDRATERPEQEQARKLRTLAGNYQLLQLAPWLASPAANPIWFRFVSHKLLRLLAPWLMLVMLVTAAMLASRHVVYMLALIALLGLPVLTLAGRLLPAVANWLPLRLATAFCYLNLYSAQALWVFLRQRRLHLW